MKEKVYSVDNHWDMTIIEGTANYNGRAFHYANIFSDEKDDWTDEYLLTPLPDDIFEHCKSLQNYWFHWLSSQQQTKIPHPIEYAKEREATSFEKLIQINTNAEEWEKAELNYQNQLIFNNYLKSKVAILKAKGSFFGKINGTETFVEWTEAKINEEAIEILHSENLESATSILLYLCFNFDDWRLVQKECISLIRDKKLHKDIRQLAVICLGHLARIHSTIDKEEVIPILELYMKQDSQIAGTIADALEDIKLFIQ
ncbi:hypothetical protein [Bacteroides sp. 224]|uniref:hypothetical protein n=1 Tax=Bacteroides sp. 224 TaxID=2302936 RepID=UPI0013D5F100|nr:hypothetical protein [Bacteroides sp. 224]NDV66766.1 hypothetical protein [Bacteroides sp. 224]